MSHTRCIAALHHPRYTVTCTSIIGQQHAATTTCTSLALHNVTTTVPSYLRIPPVVTRAIDFGLRERSFGRDDVCKLCLGDRLGEREDLEARVRRLLVPERERDEPKLAERRPEERQPKGLVRSARARRPRWGQGGVWRQEPEGDCCGCTESSDIRYRF